MKNKLSVFLLTLMLCGSFTSVAYAADTEIDEGSGLNEISEAEIAEIQAGCKELGLENDLQGEDLTVFISECFDANTMVIDDESPEMTEEIGEDQDIPAADNDL